MAGRQIGGGSVAAESIVAPGILNATLKEAALNESQTIPDQRGTGFSAFSPDVPGCAATGDTEEETRRNFQDALSAHFEIMRELGQPIPAPHASVDYVEVTI